MSTRMMDLSRLSGAFFIVFVCVGCLSSPMSRAEQTPAPHATGKSHVPQRAFSTPEEAAAALVEAVRGADPKQIHSVLGPGSGKLISSGDPVEDARRRERFVAAYDEAVKIESSGEGKATLLVGAEQWPFPFPLLKTAAGWRFDVKSGAEEIL